VHVFSLKEGSPIPSFSSYTLARSNEKARLSQYLPFPSTLSLLPSCLLSTLPPSLEPGRPRAP